MNNKGFTVIEMLVVISVMVLLTSLLILYSRTGESQIILFRDQARLIAALNRAKFLSTQLYSAPESPCGFGVYFSQAENSFLIFRDSAANCSTSDNIYSGADELFENYQLSPQVKFGDLTLTNIIFIPPDPETLIDNDPNKIEGIITLQNLNGSASLNVKVNNAGQITTQ
ncbi:MAG: prepilin-type N-terminal cleavage/methylation domain-containing protein [Candidatus Paceibacterota bacterium]